MMASIRLLISLPIALQFSACSASEIPSGWKTDCVGQMQVSFPGEVDVAAQTPTGWKRPPGGHAYPSSRFADDQRAPWSESRLKISQSLSAAEMDDLVSFSRWTPARFKERAAKNPSIDKKSFLELPTAPQSGYSWRLSYRISRMHVDQSLLLNLGGHLVFWEGSEPESDRLILEKEVNALLTGISYRPLYTVPAEPGDCHPYVFVKDGGKKNRTIAMTYRLRDHPDITIVVRDNSRWKNNPDQPPHKLTAAYEANSFWTSSMAWEKIGSIGWDGYRPTRLAGRFGVESYVKMRRKDQSEDFGYLVAVQGDPEAEEYSPHLLIAVIRESSNARKKGIEPFGDEKTFLEFARSITATVQRRPSAVMPVR